MFSKTRPEYLMMASGCRSSWNGKNSGNLLRLLCLLCCFAGGLLWAQPTKLLVFKNGKTMEFRGDYEIKDGKLEFTNTDGDLIFVDVAKVDIQRTEKYAEVSAEKARTRAANKRNAPVEKPRSSKKPDSLPEQIAEYQKRVEAQEKDSEVKLLEYTGQKPQQADPEPRKLYPADFGRYEKTVESIIPQWIRPEGSNVSENTRNLFEGSYAGVWFGWLILGGLMGLASFITWLFIMVYSYYRSFSWGAGLTFSFCGLILMAFIPGISGQLRPAFYLLHYGLFVAFLFTMHRKRLLLFTLWLSPYLWAGATLVGILFWKS